MTSRLQLHDELLKFHAKVYFQPPSNLQLSYPCIVYSKTPNSKKHANNSIYGKIQGYQITVIENNPDSDVSDMIEQHFKYCAITQHYVFDTLHHTTLDLYY